MLTHRLCCAFGAWKNMLLNRRKATLSCKEKRDNPFTNLQTKTVSSQKKRTHRGGYFEDKSTHTKGSSL
ncbi:MAG TPA: hypothetical protein DCE42_21385 [Myxococcales bacterium]|nr:hypothetical protein [Myxococcales bacterium]